jgi:hypothetical protein
MPVFEMTKEKILNHPTWDVLIFGRSPLAIYMMTAVKGLDFEEVFGYTNFF